MTTSTLTRRPATEQTAEPDDGANRDLSLDAPKRKVAAVMFPLDRSEAAGLQEQLGPWWQVAEGRDCEDPDLVIVRPCSMQTIAGLRHRFPDATMIAIEPGPANSDPGRAPIGRALAAGLDRYAIAVDDLRSLVADRASRPCRRRSARWRRWPVRR